MKFLFFSALLLMCMEACSQHNQSSTNKDSMQIQSFKAERITRSATILLNGSVERVFPLFNPELEKLWAPDWNYSPLLIDLSNPQEYSIFTKASHTHDEGTATWVISKLDSVNHVIEYILFTRLRVGIINIKCGALSKDKSQATITYSFTGLSLEGNELGKHLVSKMYSNNMKDWEEAINSYLAKSK